jgi:8-oxo-dGTP pyrophosphatase MutT (NUDIX family)
MDITKFIVSGLLDIENLSNNEIYSLGKVLFQKYWTFKDTKEDIRSGIIVNNIQQYICKMYSDIPFKNIQLFLKLHRNVVNKWPIAGVIIFNRKREVLLVKNNGSNCWSYPKGKIELGEDAFIAGIRECYEETGIDTLKYIKRKRRISSKINGKYTTFYIVEDFDDSIKPRIIDKYEITDIKWVKFTEAFKTNRRLYNIYINKTYDLLISFLQHNLPKRTFKIGLKPNQRFELSHKFYSRPIQQYCCG